MLETIKVVQNKDYVHKVSNLLVEIQGAMFEENEEIWQDLLNLVFQLVQRTESSVHVDAALQTLNGLFSYIIDHMNKYKDDLFMIF